MQGSAAPAAGPGSAGAPMAEAEAVGVEVISFDLDDTLWCGKTVIANANKYARGCLPWTVSIDRSLDRVDPIDAAPVLTPTPTRRIPTHTRRALQAYLEAQHPQLVGDGQPSVASLMGALAKQYPEEFLEDPEDPSSIVRFTDLRKLALSALAQRGGYAAEAAQAVAVEGFRAWHNARHDVDALFYPGAVDLLRRLKSRGGVRLVAVTNGNCDIAQIAAFDGVFEFCINAERVGARKRTGKPYTAAIKQAGLGADVGPRWVHIGDDFTEDIVAAKSDLKLRTIWYRTAERKAKAEAGATTDDGAAKARRAARQGGGGGGGDGAGAPSLSTLAGMATEAKDRFFRDKGVVQVTATEADDFLAYSIVKEFADAEVETIEEMGSVLDAWLAEGAGAAQAQAVAPASASAAAAAPQESVQPRGGDDTKFCISCREVLPKRAKFCSACGEAQG